MKVSRFNAVLMAALLMGLASCSVENLSEETAAPESKIVNPSAAQCCAGNILIFNAPDASTESLDSLRTAIGAEKICPVFNLSTGDVALKRQCGMQNWYKAHFADDAVMSEKATLLAGYSCVKAVEFNRQMSKANVGPARPFRPRQSLPLPSMTRISAISGIFSTKAKRPSLRPLWKAPM